MSIWILFLILLGLAITGYIIGRQRAWQLTTGANGIIHSRPGHHGMYVAIWVFVPATLIAILSVALVPVFATMSVVSAMPDHMRDLSEGAFSLLLTDIRNLAGGNATSKEASADVVALAQHLVAYRENAKIILSVVVLAIAGAGFAFAFKGIHPDLRARNRVELAIKIFLIVCSVIAIITTLGIILSLVFESFLFFFKVSIFEFLFGLHWSPQTALRADQAGASGSFGSIPLFVGTLLITFIAMCVAVPVGLLSAIYLSDYASDRIRGVVKPILEILAGIPTVVYGFFAALTMAPLIRNTGEALGLDVASESALAAGVVMGVMIIPFVSSLSDDVINSVPQSLREAAFGLGATKSECLKQVVLPAALPGIFAAVLLAISRAIGETMIVVMAAGLGANLTLNPLEQVTTVTVQIVSLLTGDQEFDSAKTLSAFALGLMLFIATLTMNIVALRVVRKYREKYD